MHRTTGFTLLEVMVVVVIIAVLALLSLPNDSARLNKLRVVESLDLVEAFKQDIVAVYRLTGKFPEDNEQANLPAPDKIKGNFLRSMSVENGVITLEFGQKMIERMHGKKLSIQPVIIEGEPRSPVSWICGLDEVPEGMQAVGKNQTDVPATDLPLRCH